MKSKYLVAAVVAVALLLTGIAWSLDSGLLGRPTADGDQSISPSGGSASSVSDPSVLPDGSGKAEARLPAKTEPARSSAAGSGPKASSPAVADDRAAKASRPSWNPQPAASETAGLEMPTATPGTHKALPKSKVKKPTLSAAPKNGVAKGKLTSSFPKKAVPVPPHLKITSSSVAAQGTRVLVGVDGRSKSSSASILAFFNRDFAARGWTVTRSTPADLTTTLRGTYGQDAVVATVRQLPTGQTALTVAGTFKVGD